MITRASAIGTAAIAVLVLAGVAWPTVVGTWDVTGTATVKVTVGGQSAVEQTQVNDQFIFHEDGTFETSEEGGTWRQNKRKFTVLVDTVALEESLEASLLAQGYVVDVSVRKIVFTGTESRDGGTIRGKSTAKVDVHFLDLGQTGKLSISIKYSGTRASAFGSGRLELKMTLESFSGAIGEALDKAVRARLDKEVPR